MKPEQFRRIPLAITAMQYELETRDALIAWIGEDHCRHVVMDNDGVLDESHSVFIHTMEGELECRMGDWVICGIEGEFYPCKDSVFQQTYVRDPEVIPHTEYMRRSGQLIAAIMQHKRQNDAPGVQDLHLYHVMEKL